MLFLKEINICNFKSFTTETISFNNTTSIVGPNESGKSNLLDAIYHLSQSKQMTPFSPDDLRIGAPSYPNGEIQIKYSVILNKILLGDLLDVLPNLNGKIFYLTKKGKPKMEPVWECDSNITQNVIPDLIKINHKKKFNIPFHNLGKNESTIAKKRSENGWFINEHNLDLRKNPYNKLLENNIIQLLKSKDKIEFVNRLLKERVLKNVKIYQWKYKEEDFLQSNVSIADIIQSPNKYRTIYNMFLISGWKRYDLSNNLQNQTNTVYSNLLRTVKRTINSLIRNQWSSHKNLKIELVHTGEHISIHLHEPGSSTPPEYRSDGLKWFLTFLINFRAQSQSTKNYILLIDEPGLFLHPQGQKDVLDEINNLSKENQVIYTTHQTFLIDKNKPERVRIISRITDRSGALALDPFYASKVNNIIDTKSILTDRLLREALGFKVSDISPLNEKNILVEGLFDREIFLLFNDFWQILNLNEISIISCGRASEIAKHTSLYKNNNLKILCFYDSDEAGKSSYKYNDKAHSNEKYQIRDFINDPLYETMEDLIPDAIFNVSVNTFYKKWGITINNNIYRPRMKNLDKYICQQDKRSMKHSLEEIILEKLMIANLNDPSFLIFKQILEKFAKSI